MTQVVIENPILNSPYKKPNRHFKFSEEALPTKLPNRDASVPILFPLHSPRKKLGQNSLRLKVSGLRIE